jgi:hypothetical protein
VLLPRPRPAADTNTVADRHVSHPIAFQIAPLE